MDIEINTNQLNSEAMSMNEKNQNLKKVMAQMNDAVNALNSMWSGTAHDALVTQYGTDYDNMKHMCEIIDGIVDYMNNAISKYNTCDSEVESIISGINI